MKTCTVFVTGNDLLRGIIGLLIGLAVVCVGHDVTAWFPRYTFEIKELLSGIDITRRWWACLRFVN